MKTKASATLLIVFATALLLPSCNVKYDMVTFKAVGIMPAVKTPVPSIEIDTNVTAGMTGGAVKSNKPYDIRASYMDDTFIFAVYYMDKAPIVASVEFTKVTVAYADGTVDPGANALNLPMRFKSFVYEGSSRNTDGSVVHAKSRRIEAELPGSITRDEPFTLLIDGRFTKDTGTSILFTIKKKYDMESDKRTETWVDYISSC